MSVTHNFTNSSSTSDIPQSLLKRTSRDLDHIDVPRRESTNELVFVTVIAAVVVAWLLVALWTRVIENFSFGTLGLNGNSAWHAFIVAATVTTLFIVTIWVIDQYDLVPGGLETIIESREESGTRVEIPGTNIGANIGSGNSGEQNTSDLFENRNGVFIPTRF